MTNNLFRRTRLAVVALTFPIAAWADLSNTVTLTANTALSLDTGTTASSGGDILWNSTSFILVFDGKAKGAILTGFNGAAAFNALNQSRLQAFGPTFSTSALPGDLLTVGTIFGVLTNGGNYSGAMVTAISATSITLQYTTYESTAPTITAIQNNYSYIQPGFPNYGIAPSTLFIVKGTNLASATTAVLQSSAAPGIPTTGLNGATMTVTVNGVTVHPGFYYAIATQLAAVLPASTPTGTGTLTVNYNGASASATITVVASALGFDTYYGTGSGLIVATSPTTGALYNYTNSAAPGQTIVLWASGLGADTADSDTVFASAPHAVNAPLQIYFGGVQGTIGYQGSSGYPGVNQINVTIPSSVGTGCNVAVIAASGNVVSNSATLPIAQGGGICSDPAFGTNGAQLGSLSGQSTVSSGVVFLIQGTSPGTPAGTTRTISEAAAIFESVTGASYGASSGSVSIPGCIITQIVTGGAIPTVTGLDAGTITVTGPSGGPVTLSAVPTITGESFAQLAAGFIPASGGTFTFKGSGGANVGSFSVSVTFPNPPLVWTNQSAAATVNRAQGVTATWTGGTPGSYVIIGGTSSSSAGASGSYTCLVPVSAGQFTVPSYVLLALPAGTGTTAVENSTNYTTFSASGISAGIGFGGVSFSVNSIYN